MLVASFAFYAYGQPYLLLLLVIAAALSAATSYAVMVDARLGGKQAWAIAGVVLNLSILGFLNTAG